MDTLNTHRNALFLATAKNVHEILHRVESSLPLDDVRQLHLLTNRLCHTGVTETHTQFQQTLTKCTQH